MAGGVIPPRPSDSADFFATLESAITHSIHKPIEVLVCYSVETRRPPSRFSIYRSCAFREKARHLSSPTSPSRGLFDGIRTPSVLEGAGAMELVCIEFTSSQDLFRCRAWRMGFARRHREHHLGTRAREILSRIWTLNADQVAAKPRGPERPPKIAYKEMRETYSAAASAESNRNASEGPRVWQVPPPAGPRMFAWSADTGSVQGTLRVEFSKLMVEKAEGAVSPGPVRRAGEGLRSHRLLWRNEQRIRQAAARKSACFRESAPKAP